MQREIKRTVVKGLVRASTSALPAAGYALGIGAAVYAVHSYFQHLASLDWVPDLYQNPLM